MVKTVIDMVRHSRRQKILLVTEILLFAFLLCYILIKPRYHTTISGSELWTPVGGTYVDCLTKSEEEGLLAVTVPDTGEEVPEDLFARAYLTVPAGGGAFHVTADYANLAAQNPDVLDAQCYFDVISEEEQDRILYNAQMLWDNARSSEGTFWISPFADSMEIILPFYVKGSGMTVISALTVTESMRYRLCLLVLYMAGCSLVWCYIWFVRPRSAREKAVLLILAMFVFYSSLPLFAKGCYDTRDMLFHLKRIDTLAEGLLRGEFPVRYEPNVANGYGYVEHIFYPNLFLYIPAVLHMLDLPLYMCYKFFLFATNALTCAIAYWSYRKIFSSRVSGILGAGIYTLSIYRIFNLYGLNAVGAFSAKMFLPLLCYGLWKIARREDGASFGEKTWSFSEYMPLVVSGVGIVCSHVITCEILVIFLPLFILFNRKIYIKKQVLLKLCKAGLLVAGCCAFFLVPCIDGLRMKLEVNRYEGASHSISLDKFGLEIPDLFRVIYDEEYYATSAGHVFLIGLLLFGVCAAYRQAWNLHKTKGYEMMCSVAALAVLSLWMCTNRFPWGEIGSVSKRLLWLLAVVQFPYRYLTVVMTAMTLVTCYGVKTVAAHLPDMLRPGRTWLAEAGIGACLVALCVLEASSYMGAYVRERDVMNWAYGNNEINMGLGLRDYMPEGVHSGDFRTREIVCSSDLINAQDCYAHGAEKYYAVSHGGEEDGYVELPVFAYDQMRAAAVETGQELETSSDGKGRLRVNIPAGFSGTVKVFFQVPILWRMADIVSLMFWIGCAAAACRRSTGSLSLSGRLRRAVSK